MLRDERKRRNSSAEIADDDPGTTISLWRNVMTRSDVLIVGAGPTGLVLALWLRKLGVGVRIIDKTAEPGTTKHPPNESGGNTLRKAGFGLPLSTSVKVSLDTRRNAWISADLLLGQLVPRM
jgi:NADPH-dependent 2,4-dienoyl-CoA reductase/sulfur reductase-like enzyme